MQSVNGPSVTLIHGNRLAGASGLGDSAVRCVFLTNGSVLSGFTLTNGATRNFGGGDVSREQSGGGAWAETNGVTVVHNCVLIGNSAAYYGGGAYGGTLNSCTVVTNRAYQGAGVYGGILNNCIVKLNRANNGGGGVWQSILSNCTLVGNRTSDGSGGGASGGILENCIVYYNAAIAGSNYTGANLEHCCTIPLPVNGIGHITNEPAFIDFAGGDLRLQSNSPCINAGKNSHAPSGPDLDGNPRIAGGTVDMGAYEFQSPSSVLSYAWAQQNGLPTDGSADFTDDDGDGANNWQEWVAGTIPTNALSVLHLLNPTHSASGITVTWQSVSSRTYFLERSVNLGAQPAFLTLVTNIPGQSGTTSFTDTNAVGSGPFFYRVGVETGSNQFHLALSVIPFTWLQQYDIATDGSADFTDADGDGANNWQEWRADTIPTDALSALRMVTVANGALGLQVTWQSVSTRNYWLERATNLADSPPFQSIATSIAGASDTTTYADTSATNGGLYFYRVGVQ